LCADHGQRLVGPRAAGADEHPAAVPSSGMNDWAGPRSIPPRLGGDALHPDLACRRSGSQPPGAQAAHFGRGQPLRYNPRRWKTLDVVDMVAVA
jgi:hypothetical protein